MEPQDSTIEVVTVEQKHEIERLNEQLARAVERADALADLQQSINARIHDLWKEWAKASDARFDVDKSMEDIQDRMQRMGREIYYAQQAVKQGTPDAAALRLLKRQIDDLDKLHNLHEQILDEGVDAMRDLGLSERRHVENKRRVKEDTRRHQEDERRELEDDELGEMS